MSGVLGNRSAQMSSQMGKEDLLNAPGEENINLEMSDNPTPEPDLWRNLSFCPVLCISPDSCHTLSKNGCSELGLLREMRTS